MVVFDKRFRLDDNTTVLRHNHNDIDAFTKIMNLTDEVELDGKDNITQAYMYYKENLNSQKVDFKAITNAISLVVIDLSPDEDEQQIFDTINSLGVRLTTAELLKNFFFGRNDYENYSLYWKNIFEIDEETKAYWDREITTGRFKRSLIDMFFYSYLQIKLQEESLAVKTDDKKLFSKVEKLFESYKRFIKEYCAGDKKAILEEICEYAKLFMKTFNPNAINNELVSENGIERINVIIFALETTTLIPYVLFIERNVMDINAKNELYVVIESYLMRRLICKETTKNYNQLFTDSLILNRVLSKQNFLVFLENMDQKVNYLPSDTQLQDAIKCNTLTNKQATGVLYLMESGIRDRKRHSTQLLGISRYSLEHIMPKKWENNWGKLDSQQKIDERNRKLMTLGNLTIITQSLNASIRDADWETKKGGRGTNGGLKKYANGMETFDKYLNLAEWDENIIAERASFLYDKAIKLWNNK